MGIFTRQPPRRRARIARPLVASAQAVSGKNSGNLRRLSQAWQERALGYYDTVGECWYPAQFYARAFPRIRFFPAILDERGDPQEVEEGPLVDAFARIRDPGGSGHGELTGAYGRLQWLIGDGYLTVTEDEDEEAWEFLSPLELRVKPDARPQKYSRIRAPGIPLEDLIEASDDDFEPLGNKARVWRLHRRHPAYTQLADSPVRAVLDLYELLTHLTLAASAESKSRAANRGAIFVPDELDFGSADAEEPDEDPESDPFLALFTEALTTAIANPGSAAAMSPIVMRGKGFHETPTGSMATKDMIGWLALGPDSKYAEGEMWDKVIDRIAGSLDYPREFVSPSDSVGGANHWGGWLLDEQAFRQHVAPSVERFCGDIASAFLRPFALREGIEDADRVIVWYDAAEAINHPDEIKTAQEAWDRGVVSNEYYLDKIGATEADAPDEEELRDRLLFLAKKLPGDDEEQEGETSPQDGGHGGDTDEEIPDTDDDQVDQDEPRATVAAARIATAVELQLERARELAGNRLVRRSQGCDDCKQAINGVSPALVAYALGRDQVREIIDGHASEAQLVAGAGEKLATTLLRWGIAERHAETLGGLVERHALETLYDREPLPITAALTAAVAEALA